MKKSIFTPLIDKGYTTLIIRYNWKKDQIKMEALKEWEPELDFSDYNKEFYADDILTEELKCFNTIQTKEMYCEYGLGEYLDEIIDLIRAGKHYGVVFFYNAKRDIRLICHQHCKLTGLNNRLNVGYLDGIRRYEPEDDEMAMIKDGLNISRGMSFKLLAGHLPFGGSKTMVQMPPLDLTDMEALGFIAYAFDRNHCTTGADMNFPTALADVQNKSFSMNFTSGPNSPLGETGKPTAYGVGETLKKAVLFKEGTESLAGKKAVLMGLGAVGWYMGEYFLNENVELYITDMIPERVQEFIDKHPEHKIGIVAVDEALYVEADIISPCAVGNLIDRNNVDKLKCRYIWGSANGQIIAKNPAEEIEIAGLLAERDIMFQTEWWHNTGGVICGGQEYIQGENATYEKLIKFMDENVTSATWKNLNEAKKLGITPTENAYRVCEKIIYA